MTKKLTATEAKTRFLALLDDVEEGEEIEVSRRGRPIALIIPIRRPHELKGRYKGIIKIHATDEELFSTGEEWESS